MKAKNMAVLLIIFIFSILACSCSAMEPNQGTVHNPEGPAEGPADGSVNGGEQEENLTSGTPVKKSVSDHSVLQAEWSAGTVTYEIEEVEWMDSYQAAGVDVSETVDQKTLKEGEKYLQIKFSLENEDIDKDTLDGEYLVNNFFLADKDTLDSKKEGAYLNSPIYFNQAQADIKRYFALELPAIGEKTEIVLGWRLSPAEIEFLETHQLYLIYTTRGLDNVSAFPLDVPVAG